MSLLLLLRKKTGGGVAPLDIKASVGTSTSPTSTGTKAVTGVGFEPKVVMPFGVNNTTDGTATTCVSGFGAMTSASQAAIYGISNNAVATSETHRRHTNAAVVSMTPTNGVGVAIEASRSSLNSDGFTLNWTTVLADARILNHICLGGADLEVSLTQHQMNATNAAQSFAHGLSGAPTGLLFFSALNTSTPANTTTELRMSIGFYADGNQFTAGVNSGNGLTTTLCQRSLRNDAVLVQSPSGSRRAIGVSSIDETNVNCTYPLAFSSAQSYFWMLAIRGAKCQTGTFNCNGSTSPLTINTTGITPKLFLPVFVPLGVQTPNTVHGDANLWIGASDGVNNVSCGITDRDAQTTTNARRAQSSTAFEEYNTVGTLINRSTASFVGESVVVTPTTMLSNSYGQAAYLVIGS